MKIWVDNKLYLTDKRVTIFQFCASVGINLPCFCYHEKLSIAGNCRMCLVEVTTAANLVVSCAMPLLDKMRITTFSKRVRKARENILEFLLINHPLDCPVCDQGGECDLQDLSMVAGSDRSRFYESFKRAVDNLQCFGPLIKTVMTRCVHCTRCVRFLNEIGGTADLGVIGRGLFMEIGTYVEMFISDELIGNIIDLCPVGALTSMPYAYQNRSWELDKYKSIDVLDALASSVRLDCTKNNIARMVPSLDENINEEWMTNKARYCYDALNIQRLYYPQIMLSGKFIKISWARALVILVRIFNDYKHVNINVITGDFLNLEAAIALKQYFSTFGCSNIYYYNNNFTYYDYRFSYLLNTSLIKLEALSLILFLGTNIRLEAPLVNARIRKAYLSHMDFSAFAHGLGINHLTYPVLNIGNCRDSLLQLFMGRLNFLKYMMYLDVYNLSYFNNFFVNLNIFLGMSFFNSMCSDDLWYSFLLFCSNLNITTSSIHIINIKLGRMSGAEFGLFLNFSQRMFTYFNNSLVYLCGVDLESINRIIFKKNKPSTVVYQGSFVNNISIFNIKLVLPVGVYTEIVESYINLEGRYRKTQAVVVHDPPPFIFSNEEILRILSSFAAGFAYPLDRKYDYLISLNDFFNKIINYKCSYFNNLLHLERKIQAQLSKKYLNKHDYFYLNNLNWVSSRLIDTVLVKNIYNYYASDVYSLNSKTMMLCARKNRLELFDQFIK